ncbi:Uncharacterised protein [Serratia liquefaciens]|uniref:hypothetical protein n=1 Tax=Serratia liquefaciens TaxID=614 RepID=UPI00217C148A|nr:hypothetical protein [Serratia liquefaciens]CAI1214542.1 Uncharacterised protein [Serratia liquefaciens]CAI1850829.1 Uncharacterised protein [Serratia liquefaciens]
MIKRFNPDFSLSISHELAYMRETPEGGYVAHGDYATLFSELEVVKAERDALAVENAALKTAHPQPFGREMMKALDAYEKHQDEVPETGMLDAFFILRDSIRVETPATSAALADIEARGVEKAATKLYGSGYVFEVLMRHATELREAK